MIVGEHVIVNDRRDYFKMTLLTVARVLARTGGGPLAATIRIDGLPQSQERLGSRELRRLGVAGGRYNSSRTGKRLTSSQE